ncbi:MAG: membrane protein insertion efficiency factor YidD [Candidatus Bipolaricaulota bacterium]
MVRWVRVALTAPIFLYQCLLSPLLPHRCRFVPSCSEYARHAILQHGVFRGAGLALRRLARCGPWHPGGPDPVP